MAGQADKWELQLVIEVRGRIPIMTNIPQVRAMVTSIPGPKSQEILKRRAEAVSSALGMAIPIIVERAGGGHHYRR